MDLKQKLELSGLTTPVEDVKSKWTLRMESDSFIMVINKKTGEYVNWYAKDTKDRETLQTIAGVLDKHRELQR